MNIPVAFPSVPTSRYARKLRQLRLPTPFDFAMSKVFWPPVLPTGGDHASKCLCVGRPLALSRLVGSSGLEPPTSRLSGGCSNQLSYKPMLSFVPHVTPTVDGIRSRRELRALVVGGQKHPPDVFSVPPLFESLLCSRGIRRGSQQNPHRIPGGDDGIRTHDPLLAGQVLSQLSYTPISRGSLFHREPFRIPDDVGIDLSSRAVARRVLSAQQSLTSVFGMGTGGPFALKTPTSFQNQA